MLAYVFWHWKRALAAAHDYENRQRAFHAALARAPSDGFLSSFSVGVSGAPWAASGADAYEDWYLVRDFGALGALNEAAVSASRAAPHDAAAELVSGGTAGVYRLRCGVALHGPTYACWFGKPPGMSYSELLGQLTPLAQRAGAALWGRQLVLGPAPEFCLHASAPVALPDAFAARALEVRRVWAP